MNELKRNQCMFSPLGEWIPYCETDLEDEYFKVDNPMTQEDLEEALPIQPSMSSSIILFVNPINSFEETMTETKYFSLYSNDFSDDDDDEIKYEYMESPSHYTIICEEFIDDDICTKVQKLEIAEPVADVINLSFLSQSLYKSPQPCLEPRPPDINYDVVNQWVDESSLQDISLLLGVDCILVATKESLLDTVAQEEAELEVVLEDLGINRKMRVKSRVKKVEKSQSTILTTSIDGYSKDKMDAIRVDTYVDEEEDKEIEDVVAGIVDGLDGVSLQTVRNIQGDDNERSVGENEKVELELSRLHENDARQYNQEFTEELDRIREANEDKEDQHVKVYFKFVEATQTAIDLAQKIEEKDTEIEKGQKKIAELKEHTANLKSQNDTLMVKSREADMARYRIQSLERSKEGLNRSMTGLKNDLIRTNNNLEQS
ncbi:hypothetical protein GIB67_034183 [Kingdonia uniflora]|uniref:Uncharacterized protein n=1 Tax=Kingdonia uniflora TaxID=39325 RepID=A0A7J7NRF8_9MAGN|nr:hypothetical protein GIB67_034183 [Kingdonia uniflora]